MNFPLRPGLKKASLPLKATSGQKLKNLCFLIDTGSDSNIIFDFVYHHYKDEFALLPLQQKIMGIEGHYTTNPIIEGTLNIGGTDYTSRFIVLNASDAVKNVQDEFGIQIHGILGIEFLIKNKWIIDFEKLEVRTNGEI